jgi:calnexin
MQNDILFDNIYIGHSSEDAEKLKAETWDVKHPIELAEDEATKPKPADPPKSPMDLKFMDDPVLYVREKVDLFMTIAKKDPVQAIKFVPEVAGGIGILAVTLIAVIIGAVSMSGASPPPQVKSAAEKVKKTALDAKDQVMDAAASGADKAQTEINKRTTRSSGAAAE